MRAQVGILAFALPKDQNMSAYNQEAGIGFGVLQTLLLSLPFVYTTKLIRTSIILASSAKVEQDIAIKPLNIVIKPLNCLSVLRVLFRFLRGARDS